MGFFNDFLIGFLKPLRDLAASIPIYALVTANDTLRSTLQNSDFSFNIWIFLLIYIGVSSMLELIADANYNLRRGYKEPIDSAIRITGLLLGTILFSLILLPVYSSIGGDVSDAFISTIIAALFSCGGTAWRLYRQNKLYYGY
ncbi:MAG: hypothetical protein Q7T80_17025 [Methanoregula sp.]|nr:hypothetical protein [Methanoregula sp.]